jgi:hypothetical protein
MNGSTFTRTLFSATKNFFIPTQGDADKPGPLFNFVLWERCKRRDLS